ncbi:MAG TPA: phenylalanine--tRNA ligase beta subunit-related protein [Patescibacteria group bacterium]
MKLIYSHLKKFLPTLDVEPQKLRDDLSMIGHFTNYYEEKDGEIIFDLDIKTNRGDCLGYYGLARDLSVYYSLPLVEPFSQSIVSSSDYQLPIKVTTPDVVRIMSLKISGVRVDPSPQWLRNFVKLHNINSVNNIVDLTNYVMFMYGIPNHAFDAKITSDELIWENNNGKNKQFTTLDGTILDLSSENLVISNPGEVLSTGLVGGKKSGITTATTDIIIEVAIYNRVRIRLDSKQLKTVTEASIRLEKDLDPETIPVAFEALAALIGRESGGQISSAVFDYYPSPVTAVKIIFDPGLPSRTAGIEIPADKSLEILKRLGASFTPANSNFEVTPPTIRKDITMEEDLVEEVIRFWGYSHIPTSEPLSPKTLPDITPKIIYLEENFKNELVKRGYDEVRGWPLIKEKSLVGNSERQPVFTQNSINSDYPVLRTSLISSILDQKDQYDRYKVPEGQFFETGKVFYRQNGEIIEKTAAGIYNVDAVQLKSDLVAILGSLGIGQGLIDSIHNSDSDSQVVEIVLDDLVDDYQPTTIPALPDNHAWELTSQIITLDANVTFSERQDMASLIRQFENKAGEQLWQLVITDEYHDQKSGQYRYTFRASYFNIDDKTAKNIHKQVFGL